MGDVRSAVEPDLALPPLPRKETRERTARMTIQHISLDHLDPHPDNPRIEPRQDVIESLAARMREGGFDEAHALIVRPIGDRFQIISGHHRAAAAREAALSSVPAWVREMPDDEAFMALALCNTHGELTPLERGMHALKSGMTVRAYADLVGRGASTVDFERRAAKVASACPLGWTRPDAKHLSEIHAAPSFLWPALVEAAAAEDWTVERVRKAVAAVKDAPAPAGWWDGQAVARAIVAGTMQPRDMERAEIKAQAGAEAVADGLDDGEARAEALLANLHTAKPSSVSDVLAIVNAALEQHAAAVKANRDAETALQRQAEQAAAKAARLRSSCSLEDWRGLDDATRAHLLSGEVGDRPTFNKTNESVEWAWWTWNPVTGCNHGCPYCYARVIATSGRTAGAFPNGFAPTLCPSRLSAPRFTKIPKEAETDSRWRNVFVCSMADLFGRWVPAEWVDAVIREARNAQDWNFLCLTKFPKRMAEFEMPANMWMGTSVDLQARVAAAEAGFARVNSKVRWISVEPMLEPLRFKRMDLFNWIVIGGASAQPATADSPATPEWRPPFEWIVDLVKQARDAGVKVYFKTNLLGHRVLELPFDAPIKSDPIEAPAVFHYLNKPATPEQVAEAA